MVLATSVLYTLNILTKCRINDLEGQLHTDPAMLVNRHYRLLLGPNLQEQHQPGHKTPSRELDNFEKSSQDRET